MLWRIHDGFPEQAIFYYLNKELNVINRYKLNNNTEIDVYIPDLQIGIEYDGAYYHKGKAAEDREKRKNDILKENNIILIRIKETESILENTDNIIYTKIYQNDDDLSNTIKILLLYINVIKNIDLNIDVNIKRDRNDIYNQYINSEKEKSLLAVNPIVAAEWHPIKNGKLLPEYVTPGSNKKVWWICKEGHEWEAVINSRNKGIGCPYCAGKTAIVGHNDLQTINPKLASEWHPTKNGDLKPSDVMGDSSKKVWWICKEGHEWQAVISSRKAGRGCSICYKKSRSKN